MPRKSKLDKIRLRQKPAAILRREVHEKYHPGESLPAMRALAMRFDVSTAVVGEALVELANEGLVVRRHGRGVYVTDRNAGARVAVLVDFDLSRPHTSFFWLRATNRLAGVLAEAGYPPHVYVGRHTTEKLPLRLTCPDFLDDVRAGRVCGVAALYAPVDQAWCRELDERAIPLVGRFHGHYKFRYSIEVDSPSMVKAGVRCLIEAGRRRLAYVGMIHPWAKEDPLFNVFATEMRLAGLAIRPEWVKRDLHPEHAGAGWQQFRDLWRASAEKPDGLLVTDDGLFGDVATAILEQRIRVSDQLLVATHANRGSNMVYPFPLIRLEFSPDEFAATMGGMLVKLMRHEPVVTRQVKAEVKVVRDTEEAPQTAALVHEQSRMAVHNERRKS